MNTRDIYVRVLTIVEFFLANAAHLTIPELQNYNPSIEELAENVKKLSKILKALSTSCEDESMAINALQCCFQMQRLADAVRANNGNDLEEIFKNLELHTCVP